MWLSIGLILAFLALLFLAVFLCNRRPAVGGELTFSKPVDQKKEKK